MASSWTFGRKLAVGIAVTVAALAAVAITGLRTTQSLVADADVDLIVGHMVELAERTNIVAINATQTVQTSSQLTSLSASLTRLVQARS